MNDIEQKGGEKELKKVCAEKVDFIIPKRVTIGGAHLRSLGSGQPRFSIFFCFSSKLLTVRKQLTRIKAKPAFQKCNGVKIKLIYVSSILFS